MERIASIEVHKNGLVFVTSGECPLYELPNSQGAGDCVRHNLLCPYFEGVQCDSDGIPSLECSHEDESAEACSLTDLRCGLCRSSLVEDLATLKHFQPLRTPCGVPVCDGCNEECRDFEDCPRPAPGQRYVSTDHVECLDCVLCEYTDEPQVQDYSDADPGL